MCHKYQCTHHQRKRNNLEKSGHLSFNEDVLNCNLGMTTPNTRFVQAKVVNREKSRYSWTRLHPFGVKYLKTSTDKLEQTVKTGTS